MATTSPDNIWTPDSGDDYALTVDLAAMADTVQDAITANKFALVGLDSERPANGSPGLVEGMTWYSTDTQIEWRYTSGAWDRVLSGQPFAMAAGSGSTGPSGTATVNLPSGRFNVAPNIVVSSSSGHFATYADKTTSTFRIILTNAAGTGQSGNYDWQAVQMTPTSAAGSA